MKATKNGGEQMAANKKLGLITLLVIVSGMVLLIINGCGSGEGGGGEVINETKEYRNIRPVPEFSDKAVESRYYSVTGYPVSDFITMHGDTLNSNEVGVAIAPDFTLEWEKEPNLYIAEGPVFDSDGNSYSSPVYSGSGEILVSLSSDGNFRWSVVSEQINSNGKPAGNGCGSPLILNDPDIKGEQIVYIVTYDTAWAIECRTGNVRWKVPTGLLAPDMSNTDSYSMHYHSFGVSYDPVNDAIVGVTGDGHVIVLERRTGAQLMPEPFNLPSSDSQGVVFNEILKSLIPYADAYLKNSGSLSGYPGNSPYSFMYSVLLGYGNKVANHFCINPATGQYLIAATSPDDFDGTTDGISEKGALYALSLKDGVITIDWRRDFEGGSGTSPTLGPDGNRVYVGDNFGKVLAIDTKKGDLIWEVDVKNQVFASITASTDNGELFCATNNAIIKVVDRGNTGEIAWISDLMAAPHFVPTPGKTKLVNLLNGSVGVNGVAVHMALALDIPGQSLPVLTGVGLLDRNTGKVRSYALCSEESVGIMQIARDGSFYMGYSPVRRPITMAVNTLRGLGLTLPPLKGGVVKFKPVHYEKLIREAAIAAEKKLERAIETFGINEGKSTRVDILQTLRLIEQCLGAVPKALDEGRLTDQLAGNINSNLNSAKAGLDVESLQLESMKSSLEFLKKIGAALSV